MKNPLFKSIVVTMLLSAVVSTQAYSRTLEVYFHNVNCPNGYQNAFMITVIDVDTGCVEACWGTDCAGKEYVINNLTKVPVTIEPAWTATFVDKGITSNGLSYTVKVQLNDGVVTNIWGQDHSGAYYVARF